MQESRIILALVALIVVALVSETLLDIYRVLPDATVRGAVSTLIGLLAGVLAGVHIGYGGNR